MLFAGKEIVLFGRVCKIILTGLVSKTFFSPQELYYLNGDSAFDVELAEFSKDDRITGYKNLNERRNSICRNLSVICHTLFIVNKK